MEEKDETSAQITKLAIELELMNGGQFPISIDFENLRIHPGGVLPLNFQMPNVDNMMVLPTLGCISAYTVMLYSSGDMMSRSWSRCLARA